jgi:hypothetical protein
MSKYIILFDNKSFYINNFINNTLKRWIIYKLLNIYKKDEIILFKTNPEYSSSILNINRNDSDIEKIIHGITNIIYKKDYNNDNVKIIFEKIKYYNELYKEDIIKYLVIISKNNFINKGENNAIKDAINYKNHIDLINISKSSIFKIKYDLYEHFINYKCFNINEIVNKRIFETNILDLEFKKDYNLYEYIQALNNIEKIFLEKKINNEIIEHDLYNKIKSLINSDIQINNKYINDVILFFKKSINSILLKFSNNKVLINGLDDYNIDINIRYILQFYDNIYKKFNYCKDYDSNTSIIKFNKIEIINEKDITDDSLDYTRSNLSLSNWIEEYNNYNSYGILIRCVMNQQYFNILQTYPNLSVSTVSNNWIGMYDYYQLILTEYEVNKEINEKYDESKIFNINDFIIIDNLLGDTNVFLPIYINKSHWKLTKLLWTYHMSLINNCYEFEYKKTMDNIYYLVLLKNLNTILNEYLNNEKKNISIANIRFFIYILRTVIQITIDNKYMFSIIGEYKRIINLILDNMCYNYKHINEWLIKILQLIVSNNCLNESLEDDLSKIRSTLFKNYLNRYSEDFWVNLKNINLTKENREEQLYVIINECLYENINFLSLQYDLIILNKIIKDIYNINGFNNFLKKIDSFNGCIPINNINENLYTYKNIKKIITTIIKNNPFDILIYSNEIYGYIDSL